MSRRRDLRNTTALFLKLIRAEHYTRRATFRRVTHCLTLRGHWSLARCLNAAPSVRLEVELVNLSHEITRVNRRSAPRTTCHVPH
jgi:hypothetical protein